MDAGWNRGVGSGVREILGWYRHDVCCTAGLEFAAAATAMYCDNHGACGRLAGTRGSAGLVVGSRCRVGRQILRR